MIRRTPEHRTRESMSGRFASLRHSGTSAAVLLVWIVSATIAIAQPTAARNAPALRTAAFEQVGQPSEPPPVTFGRYSPRVGDRVEQTVWLQMRLSTSLRQGNQLVIKDNTVMRSEQHRVVTTTDVDGSRPSAVNVHYLKATRQVAQSRNGLQHGPASTPLDSSPVPQPVAGNTYHCRRGDGNAALIVTDAQGKAPPSDEYEIVAENMETVGRVNPLADFLANRSVIVGDTLVLPQEAADRLFNLGKRFGAVKRFELTLREIITLEGAACAVFTASIEAASNDSSQMKLQVEGPLVVQVATSRAVRAELSGPLALSESRGTYSTAHQVIGTGNLTVRIASIYSAAAR
jgi:hypothetical protein